MVGRITTSRVRISKDQRVDHALGLRKEKARKRIFMGPAVGEVGEVGEVGDCKLSFELAIDEAERRRDSSIVASKLTLA